MPTAKLNSAERGHLALRVIRHDAGLPSDVLKQFYGDFMLAIGGLVPLIESGELPDADRREAAKLILSYATQDLRAVPDRPDDPLNPKIAAYTLRLFQSPELAAELLDEERKRLVKLLWGYARREIRVLPSDKSAEVNDTAFAHALRALAKPHFFMELSLADQRSYAALVFSNIVEEHTDQSKAARWDLIFLSLVSREYVFRRLTSGERKRVALKLLERAKHDLGYSPGGADFYPYFFGIRDVLGMLTREQILKSLDEPERRELGEIFFKYASQEKRISVGIPGEIRIRIDPVVLSIKGLARKTVFVTLAEGGASRVARLIYKYAEGTMQLDPERLEAPDAQILGIKVGVEAVSREHVFSSLPNDLREKAALLLFKYAGCEKGVGSPHFPLEDLTGGIVKRARMALGRSFVAESLPPELREQAVTLHERLRDARNP